MRKLEFKLRHAVDVRDAAGRVGLEDRVSVRRVNKRRRVEERTVVVASDGEAAMLKVALADDEVKVRPIGGWPSVE
jgi:hypothetical protein